MRRARRQRGARASHGVRAVGPLGALLGLTLVLVASDAAAIRYRRPFSAGIGVNYGYDHYSGSGCDDFQCGGVCYDGHSGTDFPLPFSTPVLAAADGQVSATNNGCANVGYYGNTCGGQCGNYVRVEHVDGQRTLYCHLELNSIAVSVGQHVSCGDVLGQSASSGSSTGYHLHFGHYLSGSARDPFAGSCSQSTSYWMDQGSYPHNIPSTACEPTCQCNPGDTQQGGCGNCGTHERSCGSDCHWGAWSACVGEAECPAGSVDSRPCCDCGAETRWCSDTCYWEPWGACDGPDPNGGQDECETGQPGPCAEGRIRCIDGCVGCASEWVPVPEICDGQDEDCTGIADDGFPVELGDPPAHLAAELIDASSPQLLEPGQSGVAWASFRNVGLEPWPSGEPWLVATSTWEGRPSELRDEATWPSYDVAACAPGGTAPGETASISWTVRASPTADGTIVETFQLATAEGEPLRCPLPTVTVNVRIATRSSGAGDEEPSDANDADVALDSGCDCHSASHARGTAGPACLALLLGVVFRRRRRA